MARHRRGDHTLIHAPTGSGKTLAAFLWTLDRLLDRAEPGEGERCRVLYISPLKALAHDVDRNLRAPARRDPSCRDPSRRADSPEQSTLSSALATPRPTIGSGCAATRPTS